MDKKIIHIISFAFVVTVAVLMFVASTRPPEEAAGSDLSQVLYPVALIELLLGVGIAKFWRGSLKPGAQGAEVSQFFTRHLVSLVLIESCAILGFAMTFMSGDQSPVRALGAASILGIIAVWPRQT